MRIALFLSVAATLCLSASAAMAEMYTDYTPQKGVWHVTVVKVDPNHIDDYLVGLKHTWVPGQELAKKHGQIDSYMVQIKLNAMDGQGNVLLIEHIPSMSLMDPDKARDQAMMKEGEAMFPKDKQEAQVKEYDKYRTFVGDEYWTDVSFDAK